MKRSLRFVSVIAIILSAVLLLSGCSEERKQAVANYDRECTRINAERDDLEKVIAESQKLIDSHEEPYDKTTVTAMLKQKKCWTRQRQILKTASG